MSNPFAISAVTTTLAKLLNRSFQNDQLVGNATVTLKPPDKARDSQARPNQLNLFLYQTVVNGALRNGDPRANFGDTAQPPLPLNLHYLVSAYGEGDDDALGHRLLGLAASYLYDHPLLSPDDLKAAVGDSDLWAQVERVRLTWQPLSIEEISKLWTSFQTNYRLSAAYEAAVVLIDSTRAATTPLPVLARGKGDTGPAAIGTPIPPYPTITAVAPPNSQPSARLGDIIQISGHDLGGDQAVATFSNIRLKAPIDVKVQPPISPTSLSVTIPNDPVNWVAGWYEMLLTIKRAGQPDLQTNQVAIAIASTAKPHNPVPIPNDGFKVSVDCSPQVRPGQRVSLLIGSTEVVADTIAAPTASPTFLAPALASGDYYIRLRVDGIDSLLVDRSTTPPTFDQSQKVHVQ